MRGDLIYAEGDNTWTRLPLGASGYHLRSDGTDVAWVTPAAVLVGLSGQAGAAFSWNSQNLTGIATTYTSNLVLTGVQYMANNQAIYWKDFGGTDRRIFLLTAANAAYFGAVDAGWAGNTSILSGYSMGFTVNNATAAYVAHLNQGCNFTLGAQATGTSSRYVFAATASTAPSTSPANQAQLWAADVNAAAGKTGWHMRNENTGTLIVPGILIKTDTGSPAYFFDGMICINTFDNTVDMYADAGWRTLASW